MNLRRCSNGKSEQMNVLWFDELHRSDVNLVEVLFIREMTMKFSSIWLRRQLRYRQFMANGIKRPN